MPMAATQMNRMRVSRFICLLRSIIFVCSSVSDAYADNDLHYKIPFWIGVIVISLLFLTAIIASIRYCIHTLCHSNTGKFTVASHTFRLVLHHHHRPRRRKSQYKQFHLLLEEGTNLVFSIALTHAFVFASFDQC